MNELIKNSEPSVEQILKQGLPLTVTDLVARYSISATNVRGKLETFEKLVGVKLLRNISRAWLVPPDVVRVLDIVTPWMAEDELLSTHEAIKSAIEKIAREDGLPRPVFTDVAELVPDEASELEAEITHGLRTTINVAFAEHLKSISLAQDQTLEVSLRLDLAERQSVALVRELAVSVKQISEYSVYIKNAATLAEKAICEAKKVNDEARSSADTVRSSTILVVLGGAAIIVLEAIVYGCLYVRTTFWG